MNGHEAVDAAECEVVVTRSGAPAVRDVATGELMHPVVGPIVEAQDLYVGPSRLEARLADEAEAPLVLLDVGLGAGSNAIAAWAAAERARGRPLVIVSFERSLAAMRLALAPEHAARFGFVGEAEVAARALVERGSHEGERATWRLVLGDLPATLAEVEASSADVVFWDPFSPRANPSLWTLAAFRAVRRACRAGATLHTYSASTKVRAALLLAGFAVGLGGSTGVNKQTTIAAVSPSDLAHPLDRRWLDRLARSSDPLPIDAPEHALSRISALPQFAQR